MKRRLALATALALAGAPRGHAAAPQFWRLEGTSALLEGELASLSLDSEARLRLGRTVTAVFDLEAPNGWALASAGDDAFVVGTGNDGLVHRIEGSEGRVVLDAAELEVHAVAAGQDGRTYAATSPEGAVWVIEKDGSSRVFFDPPDKYIWALAIDRAGRLLVATGDEGRVYRVGGDGTSETLLETYETHVLCLAPGEGDRVFAGSSPEGVVYRIDAPGHAFVILDSAFSEVKAIVAAEDGAVIAAVVGDQTSPPAGVSPAPSPKAEGPVAQVTVTETFAMSLPADTPVLTAGGASDDTSSASPRGAVLRIAQTGGIETLWSSSQDLPHSLLRSGQGVLVGTGSRGNVYQVNDDSTWSLLAHVEPLQVTGLAGAGEGRAMLVTSNPARVLALPTATARRGTFTSPVRDAGTVSSWGQIRWEGGAPKGTQVRLETRSGNTATPDSTWGEWIEAQVASGLGAIRSESARFLQVRATLEGADGASPEIEAISAAFLQRNRRPEVSAVTVHAPGEVFQKPISVSGEPEILGLAPDPLTESGADRTPPGTPSVTTFSRKMQQRGLRTFSWTAQDPNSDALVYQVQYRALGDDRWRPLRQGVTEPVLAWDTSAVPDGRYVIRVTASDAPDNPPALSLTGHRDSRSFEVDNAPPSLEASLVRGQRGRVRVQVKDAGSAIRRLEFSVDAGRWQEVHPVDGINDSREETYEFTVPPAESAGSRVVVLRVSDLLGNVATGRVDVP